MGCLFLLAWLVLAHPARSQTLPEAAASAPSLVTLVTQPGSAATQPPGRVVVMNREIITLRGSLFGIPAVARAQEGEERIRKALRGGGELKVGTTDVAEGVLVHIGESLMFAVIPEDTPERTLAGARSSAAAAAVMLQRVIDESRESRDLRSLLKALAVTAGTGARLLVRAAIANGNAQHLPGSQSGKPLRDQQKSGNEFDQQGGHCGSGLGNIGYAAARRCIVEKCRPCKQGASRLSAASHQPTRPCHATCT